MYNHYHYYRIIFLIKIAFKLSRLIHIIYHYQTTPWNKLNQLIYHVEKNIILIDQKKNTIEYVYFIIMNSKMTECI